MAEIVEKIDANNTKYSYYEKYTGIDGMVVLGASTELRENECGNIMPGNTIIGVWYYDKKYLENIEGIQNLLDNLHTSDEPIKEIQNFNVNTYYEKHILPDLHTKALVSMKKQYNSNGQDTRYNVEKEKADGTKVNLSFAYPASSDFREQLQNLYNSIIKIDGLEEVMFALCEVSDKIKTDTVVKFNALETLENIKTRITSETDRKQLKK